MNHTTKKYIRIRIDANPGRTWSSTITPSMRMELEMLAGAGERWRLGWVWNGTGWVWLWLWPTPFWVDSGEIASDRQNDGALSAV